MGVWCRCDVAGGRHYVGGVGYVRKALTLLCGSSSVVNGRPGNRWEEKLDGVISV